MSARFSNFPSKRKKNGFWLMSVSYPEVAEEDNEQNEIDSDHNNISNKKRKKKEEEAKGNHHRFFLIPFVSKAKRRIVSKITRKPSSPSSSSSGFLKKVCFCGIETSNTNTLEWSSSSIPDRPKGENFTLKILLQTNDFFSKDCNPHLSL
ncbi:PREDICTED: uncharacterized protein LOC109129218 [Camelina sativa]|uniref:Uncharacterized protein LOC109129218 n=1 Tax=Camelina sativa TaxID=90675 RepID=A0ABM1R0G5_CAMSA|nr:PREDICTED: uncharacterized protein LOC109129218 [Camelina sativa]